MLILGIDQSMRCSGLVIMEGTEMIHHSCYKTSKDDGSIFERFNMITTQIILLIRKYDIDRVNIEGLPMGRSIGNSHKTLAGLQAVIISRILKEIGKECSIYTPTTIKKYATGSGKAKKQEMFEAVPEHHRNEFMASGYRKTTGLMDLADAYFIALYK